MATVPVAPAKLKWIYKVKIIPALYCFYRKQRIHHEDSTYPPVINGTAGFSCTLWFILAAVQMSIGSPATAEEYES